MTLAYVCGLKMATGLPRTLKGSQRYWFHDTARTMRLPWCSD